MASSSVSAATTLKTALTRRMRSRGRDAFLDGLPRNGRLLDVGCGNNSPMRFKAQRPDLWYIGLDVGDYNQTSPHDYADEYVLEAPERFAAAIARFESQLDAVVSAHNIEHCYDPDGVLDAMLRALKPGGRIYLSFPCEESVSFPKRSGTLNFYDDPTHRGVPQWEKIVARINAAGLRVEFAAKRYRPLPSRLIGFLLEPFSASRKVVMPGTWELYGFESVIWATRPARSLPDGGQ